MAVPLFYLGRNYFREIPAERSCEISAIDNAPRVR